MPAKFGAGQLNERVAFDKRETIDDGYGNEIAGPGKSSSSIRPSSFRCAAQKR